MNFDEFIKKYNGKEIDYDGGFGVQCVDLIKLYLEEVFGIKIGAIGNAHAYFENFNNVQALKNNFERIENTKDFVPKQGDIMVWNTNVGNGAGHIAICDGIGTKTYFYSYDENWDGKSMKRVKHTYKNVYGVLRKKAENKYKNGDVIQIKYYDTGAREGKRKLVEFHSLYLKKQVWTDSLIIGTIAYSENQKYIIDLGNVGQYWFEETEIIGKA